MPIPTFDDLLLRADEALLQSLLGRPAVKLMQATQGRNFSMATMREALLAIRTPVQLLEHRETLEALLEMLSPHELREVADMVGVSHVSAERFSREVIRRPAAFGCLLDALRLARPAVQATTEFTQAVEVCKPSYALFPHQRATMLETVKLLAHPPHRVMLHMPTGSGKTRTAMQVVLHHLRARECSSVVWLATSEELCGQAVAEFQATWACGGDQDIKLIRAWGNHRLSRTELLSSGPKFVVAGLAKLQSARLSDQTLLPYLGDSVSLVVFDEAHHAVARTYREVTDVLVSRRPGAALLGLSATPGRTWNSVDLDLELSQYFGRTKVILKAPGYANPIEFLVEQGFIARPVFHNVEYATPNVLTPREEAALMESLDVPDGIRERLAEDDLRNLAIIRACTDLATRHRRLLVFGATVAHAELLAVVLRGVGVAAHAVTAETDRVERSRLLSWYRAKSDEVRVLANFGILTTGFDAPQTSAALIARPTKSLVLYSQMAGRALRGVRAGGNASGEIVTVVDTSLPGFGDMSAAFSNWEDVW